ncbi:hypothetical protein ACTFIZ_001541 [Dictyostelium cf. discoideum]
MNLENYNDKLFFSIWRNIVLRNVIINEMKLFNIFRNVTFQLNTDKEYQYWLNHQYKMYLKRVHFFIIGEDCTKDNIQRLWSILESLPENIDTVEIEIYPIFPIDILFKVGFIPRSVTSLELIGSFGSSFSKGSIHSNIKSLILNDLSSFKDTPFIQCLEGGGSANVKHLDFGKKIRFVDSLKDIYEIKKLPKGLKELLLPSFLNQEIFKGLLPKSLTSLTFGDSFNTEMSEGCLPSSITYLQFGYHFNCEIKKNVLPKRLKVLKFGELFNKSLSTTRCFNNTNKLKKLYLGREYQGEFNEFTLPKSLKVLVFSIGCKFNHPLDVDVLPPALKTLVIGEEYFKSPIESLPTSLKNLSINCSQSIENVSPFLKNLKKLELTSFLVPSVRRILNDTDFPISIKSLKISEPRLISTQSNPYPGHEQVQLEEQSLRSLFSDKLLKLKHYEGPYNLFLKKSISLRSLKITSSFADCYQCDHFSSLIESIEFSSPSFEHFAPKVFTKMKNLKSVVFSGHFYPRKINEIIFPNTLTNIELGCDINETIDFKIFPNSLRSLKLLKLDQLTLPNLPESLTCLSIGSKFPGTISSDWLKPSINHLILFCSKCKFQFPLPKSTTIYISFNNNHIIENQFYFENLIENNNLKLCSDNFINSLYDNLKKKKKLKKDIVQYPSQIYPIFQNYKIHHTRGEGY